jgi:periplasmic divalent cation tolerance protein
MAAGGDASDLPPQNGNVLPMAVIFAYVIVPHREAAEQIVTELLEHRLIACANIFDKMTSMYRWEGRIRQDSETALILKTQPRHMAEVTERIRKTHPYACPCVAVWPITAGNAEFLRWIESETATPHDMIV